MHCLFIILSLNLIHSIIPQENKKFNHDKWPKQKNIILQ